MFLLLLYSPNAVVVEPSVHNIQVVDFCIFSDNQVCFQLRLLLYFILYQPAKKRAIIIVIDQQTNKIIENPWCSEGAKAALVQGATFSVSNKINYSKLSIHRPMKSQN